MILNKLICVFKSLVITTLQKNKKRKKTEKQHFNPNKKGVKCVFVFQNTVPLKT